MEDSIQVKPMIKSGVSRVDSFIIYDDIENMEREIEGQRIQIGRYHKAEDQALYKALRKQGCNPEEAHTAILLTGSKGVRLTAFSTSKATPYETSFGNKKVLPHYHGRRRF